MYYVTNEGMILNENDIQYIQQIHTSGYYIFKRILSHHIFYAAFNNMTIEELKKKLEKGYVIDHKDENKRNNNITNLQLITYSENTQKSRDNGTIEGQVSGILYNKTTNEKYDFNHFVSSIRLVNTTKWLQKY